MKRSFSLLILVLVHSVCLACRSPDSEDYVLLNQLPPSAKQQQVVAKVELIKLDKDNQSASVRVVDAIKGVKKGEVIKLVTTGSSCSWLSQHHRFGNGSGVDKLHASGIFYIAGDWKQRESQQVFSGAWRNNQRIH